MQSTFCARHCFDPFPHITSISPHITPWGGYYYIPSTDENEDTVGLTPARLVRGSEVHSLNYYSLLLAVGCKGDGEERSWWTQRAPSPYQGKHSLLLWFPFRGWPTNIPKCWASVRRSSLSSKTLLYLQKHLILIMSGLRVQQENTDLY